MGKIADKVEISVTPQNKKSRLAELNRIMSERKSHPPVMYSSSQSYMCNEEIHSKLMMKICALQL